MELRQLRQFVAVAEAKGFSVAAQRLCMAQPPLSVAIRKLEQELGAALFRREARGVRLTAAGTAALESARRCLREAEQFTANARAADKGEAGHLCVGFIGSVTFALLPHIVQAFGARYPNVKLELHEATNHEALTAVQSGTMDLGIVRIPALPPQSVGLQVIGKDVFCVALPPGHRLGRRRSLRLTELADEPFVGYLPSQPGAGLHAAAVQLFMRAGITPVVAQEAVQVQTVIGLVASGLGVALVPSVNAPHSTNRVVFRPLSDPSQDTSIGIALAYNVQGETMVSQRFRELVGELTRVPSARCVRHAG
ncbi:MAG: LysR substrate-binding domain-containing protein [Burkholderiales bacterium]